MRRVTANVSTQVYRMDRLFQKMKIRTMGIINQQHDAVFMNNLRDSLDVCNVA